MGQGVGEQKRSNIRDLTGEQFGRLIVTGDIGIQNGRHLWKCKCDCGNETIATQDHLLQGLTKSCGCLHDTVYKENLKLVAGTSVTKLETRRGKLNSDNTSGCTGVYPQSNHGRRTGRWVAQICFQGRRYHLGCYDKLEDAVKSRKKAEEQLYDGFLDWYYQEYVPGKGSGTDANKEIGFCMKTRLDK